MQDLTLSFAETVREAARLLASARSILCITGAGLSADSGLPTYRGVGGLYRNTLTEEGIPVEEALSGPVFARRPEITWRYLKQLEAASRGATFNRGHAVLATLQRRIPRLWILTQNVDGFHRQAGSRDVIDIHGDLHEIRCTGCSFRETVPDYSALEDLPRCRGCRSVLRPDVVLFEEMLPGHKVERLERELAEGFDAVLSIGTSSLFPYIVRPVLLARQAGRPVVEINPEVTEITPWVSVRIPARAAASLEALREELERIPRASPEGLP